MQMPVIDVPVSKAVRSVIIKVRVRGLRSFKARAWLGMGLFRLGAWVIGTPVEIEFSQENVTLGKPAAK